MKAVPAKRQRPWYRQPLVWMIIAIPASSVVVGVIMIMLAVASDDGLVVDDYYKRGLEINRDLKRDRRAALLGLNAELVFDAGSRQVQVQIKSRDTRAVLPPRLTLRLVHPTRAGLDRVVELKAFAKARYAGKLERLEPGHWHLQLETGSWRVVGRMPVPGTGLSDLSPSV